MHIFKLYILFFISVQSITVFAQRGNQHIPRLVKQGSATQLIVNDKPFLILGGELGNSSASDMKYMEPFWSKFKSMHLNTILTPVYWELIEPREGDFDFAVVDSMIGEAREHNLKIVLLWFGSWKNSMSCYAPEWVKTNQKRFPRTQNKQGASAEILSPFSNANLEADKKAFVALMKHIRATDEKEQTVIMVQVENEIGMLPEARDYHPSATAAFHKPVPQALFRYLNNKKETLAPALHDAWKQNGFKTSGTWEEVFGKSLATDEIFIAWYFAVYTQAITAAGKEVYPLPMFVNAALNRPNVKPGDYPSGGPLPHVIDVWKAGAPAIDFLSPDFYNPDFKYWNDLYTRDDNPLFIPEIRLEASDASKVFYALGHYQAMGFSPFSIESASDGVKDALTESYSVLEQLTTVIAAHQGKNKMEGVLLDKTLAEQVVKLGNYTFTFKHDYTLGWSPQAKDEQWPLMGGMIIQTAPDEFIVAGNGIVVTFTSNLADAPLAGIAYIDEGKYIDGQWTPGRRMNGDQSHQGRHLRFAVGECGIQKLKLYAYK
jgi:beta-galactosidase GanA